MKIEIIDTITPMLDMDDPTIRLHYMGWDKGDCSSIGLVRILLIQLIQCEIRNRGIYYDGCFDDILQSLLNEYYS